MPERDMVRDLALYDFIVAGRTQRQASIEFNISICRVGQLYRRTRELLYRMVTYPRNSPGSVHNMEFDEELRGRWITYEAGSSKFTIGSRDPTAL